MRLRRIRTCSGKFCGPINILDTEPLRYTRAALGCRFRPPLAAVLPRVFVALGASMAVDIAQLLAFAVKNNASDLHLSAGVPPMIRVDGDMKRIHMPPFSHKAVPSL